MHIPGLGEVTKDEEFGWYLSKPIPVPMFGGKECRMVLRDYGDDEQKDDFHIAIANFLTGTPSILREADEALSLFYKECQEWYATFRKHAAPIVSADELWQHVKLEGESYVTRRYRRDKGIYISVVCTCDWETPHGLEIVLKNGSKVNRLGECYDSLTNSDHFGDDSLENVIYR